MKSRVSVILTFTTSKLLAYIVLANSSTYSYRRGVMKRYNEKLKEMKVELWKDDDLNNVEFLLLKIKESNNV